MESQPTDSALGRVPPFPKHQLSIFLSKLPAELRLKVYSLTFPPGDRTDGRFYLHSPHHRRGDPKRPVLFTVLGRDLRREVMAEFYGRATIVLRNEILTDNQFIAAFGGTDESREVMAAPHFTEIRVARIIDYRPVVATQHSSGGPTLGPVQQCWFHFLVRTGGAGEAAVVVEFSGAQRVRSQTNRKLVRVQGVNEACCCDVHKLAEEVAESNSETKVLDVVGRYAGLVRGHGGACDREVCEECGMLRKPSDAAAGSGPPGH